ncbi:ribosome biogenesis GTPase YlqF [Oxalobacter aliiformigenes]|uniref:ribosome biogenesis GTPase YlqF n=1 Tax=Oxalobacter aliiformigenes TaxID=2946593 RepID=UPI0022B070B5|nr:ribosome biogenesis GTPase YlqF [Oxalobacter aliiformigenes]MCZ4064348.1 ribosome biogenesis GTPase YlqF [Oxalobacter aliiformigenes]WAW00425.1 ribosome biogenesis GTPase YlqF [Oxalobacter aliiformigenes]
MAIQWFPGHMNAARKKAAETMEMTDLVVEVLDARLPAASSNPMVEELRLHRQRPCLKIMNKDDLADPKVTKEWLDYFNRQSGVDAVALSCKNPAEVARIPQLCQKLVPHRTGPGKPVRVMIMGIPNVGKSTLMNMLLKRRVAAVGDEPAVTKSQQRLYLNKNMVLTDTPGMLWPKIVYPSDGYMLAASHAVGVNALIEEEVAAFLGDVLLARYPELLALRYKIPVDGLDGIGLTEMIARKRGFKIRGGELDVEKGAHTLLQDYRHGAIGRISLETPESRREMIRSYAEAGDE